MSDRFSMFGPKRHSPFGSMGSDGVDEFAVDLNLTPLMDVMSNILFFLLAGFGAAIISFLAASVPVQADSDASPEAPRSDKITVSLQILSDGYKLSASGDKLTPEDMAEIRQTFPKVGGAYDRASLGRKLEALKQKYPASDTIMIVPAENITYEDIIGAMETAKDVKKEGGQKVRLFPKAVVADLVKGEADEAPAGGN
jgi:biopolymer transport protein ExbD